MTDSKVTTHSRTSSADTQATSLSGRRALLLSVATLAGLWATRSITAADAPAGKPPGEVNIVPVTDAGVVQPAVKLAKVVKSEAEWRKQLSSISFDVTRKEGTERPYSGATWNNHDKGLYRCVCCDTALFRSDTKFDSGTGWPSFWQPIAKENVSEISDRSFGMLRTAVNCARCDAHLGHVFDDGPKPTGLRYCMNSASMRFVKST
ncbi:peptide-methionine (R)-S-oxide reductase MsrB [Uliginosibacterium silvisoli]|uniref:peptide-methionine (R)-S-oxide reductase MsrB n=1 Tax=Uliginosibacterium silvisoli TaxID=3114758 RepID=UPI003A7F54D3